LAKLQWPPKRALLRLETSVLRGAGLVPLALSVEHIPGDEICSIVLVLAFSVPVPCWPTSGSGRTLPQERNGKHHGKRTSPHASGGGMTDRQNENGERKARAIISWTRDRVTVRDFYARNPSSLPPGLAKRGRRNFPPGLAKRGGKLPPGLSRGSGVDCQKHQVKTCSHCRRILERLLPPPPHEVIGRVIGRDNRVDSRAQQQGVGYFERTRYRDLTA